MQGSRVAKAATVGVLTVLFLGGMWVASGSQSLFERDADSFTVPVGHYGDHAEYFLQDDGYGTSDADCAGCYHEVRRGTFSWDFYGPEKSIDRYARERVVVRLDVGMKWHEGEGSFWGWPLRTAMDLDTREVIRYQEGRSQEGKDLIFPYTQNNTGVHIGPLGQGYAPDEMHRIAAHAQGLTFATGEDASRRIGFLGPGRDDGYNGDFGQSIWVIGKATIDGTTVWGMQVNVWESEHDYLDGQGVLTTEYEWSNVTFWLSEASPVPLRMDFEENGLMIKGGASPSREEWHAPGHAILSYFRPGTTPIPWGVPSVSEPPPRSIGPSFSEYPRSGEGWRGTFRVEDAIAAVASDPTLVDFALWKQANPGARLVGYEGSPSYTTVEDATGKPVRTVQPFGDKIQTWRLRYSAPFGATIMLIESSRDKGGVIVNRVPERNGEPVSRAARFDPAWMPSSFTVLHAADPFYKTLVEPAIYERGPNFIRWGYSWRGVVDPERYLGFIVYGRRSDDRPLLEQWQVDGAVIDAQTGVYMAGYGASRAADFTPRLDGNPNSGRPQMAPATAPSRAILVPLAATAASASLLILVAVYLFPLLQQGGIGLYTKLVKHQLLDNKLRDQLVTLIRENPGISPPALKHLTEAGWTTVIYHLSVLRDNNIVTSVREGRHRRYFLLGAVSASSFQELAILRNAKTQRVFDLVRAQPGIDRGTLARLVGVHTNAVVWHLERLTSIGLVTAEKRGRFVAYSPSRREPGTTAQVQLVSA